MAQDQIEEEVTTSQGQPTTEQEATPSQESTEEAPQEATEEVAEGKAKTKKEAKAAPKKAVPEKEEAPSTEESTEDNEASTAKEAKAAPKKAAPEKEEAPSTEQSVEDNEPSTALEQLAREVLADNGMDVVFATTDGTFFGRYNDARNHSRNIKDETVRYFARTGLPAEELRKLVPSLLLPEELQEQSK